MNLLTALCDARGTRTRLQEFAAAQAAFVSAKKDHDDAAAASAAAGASLGDLTALAGKLADERAEHELNVLALSVAADANSRRSRDLDEREKTVTDRERAVAAREVAFTERVQTLKQQLAG
jgi:hypothetical protein